MALSKIDVANMLTGSTPVANGGTGLTSGTSGQFLKFTGSTTLASAADNAGKLLQAVSATINNATESTTSQSFVASSLQLNITPSATSSKILVFLNGGQAYIQTNRAMHVTLYRDSTNLGDSTRGMARFSIAASGSLLSPHSNHFLDSPNSTSQLNYRVYYESDGGDEIYFSTGSAGTMSLTALEIGA